MSKIILVTGGNRGIGLEICRQLSDFGHIVILGSRDLSKGKQASKELSGNVYLLQLDVTSQRDIESSANYINSTMGKLDVLINNAGIFSSDRSATDTKINEFKIVMNINVYGPARLSQTFLPLLKKSDGPRIINISSGMGALSEMMGGYASYRLSKTALNGLTKMLAADLSGQVAVNAMCPGWVRTDMGGPTAPRSVEEGADTAVWLATEKEIPTGKFFRDRTEIDW